MLLTVIQSYSCFLIIVRFWTHRTIWNDTLSLNEPKSPVCKQLLQLPLHKITPRIDSASIHTIGRRMALYGTTSHHQTNTLLDSKQTTIIRSGQQSEYESLR